MPTLLEGNECFTAGGFPSNPILFGSVPNNAEPASKLFHEPKGFLNQLVKKPDVLYISSSLKVRVLGDILV
jgi:hypothetical protein